MHQAAGRTGLSFVVPITDVNFVGCCCSRYGSYLYLFCKFFVDKFIFNVKAKGKGGKSLGASGAGKSTKMA